MHIPLLFGLLACYVANVEVVTARPPSGPSVEDYLKSVESFGKTSFQKIYSQHPGNLVYSPLSASMGLLMAFVGAKGNTRTEIRQGLALPRRFDAGFLLKIADVVDRLNQDHGYKLRATNTIFYPKRLELEWDYTRSLEDFFRTTAQEVDFTRSNAARSTINGWCDEQTNGLIKEIVGPGSISSNTKLLLLNAIYFKGRWAMPFKSRNTYDDMFLVNGQNLMDVKTMHATEYYRKGSISGSRADYLELPYATARNTQPDDGVSMFIIRPWRSNGLSDLIENLHTINLKSLFDGDLQELDVSLPKFKLESTIRLKTPLKEMGFNDMFQRNANFSGITKDDNLYVKSVLQKSFIEVDEVGTKAAATTVVGLNYHTGPGSFKVNHPFLAVIVKRDGTLLFIAAITDPTVSN